MSPSSIGVSPLVALPFGEAPGRSGRRVGHLLSLAAVALVSALSFAFVTRAPQPVAETAAASDQPPAPAWSEIASPEHIYSLDATALSGAPVDYAARLRAADGGREDVLSVGALDGAAAAIRLRLFRHAGAAPGPTPLYAALAHEAATAGLSVTRSGLPEILPTRFGRFEIADLALARPDESPALPCSGFRLLLDTPGLSITGLACGARGAPLGRTEIGCLIEHLDVAAIGNDRDLGAFFAQAKLGRNVACPAPPPLVEAAVSDADMSPSSKKTDNAATGRRRLRRR